MKPILRKQTLFDKLICAKNSLWYSIVEPVKLRRARKVWKDDGKISILLPTRNRWHLISKTVESIVKQDYTDWELIIIDDGSDKIEWNYEEFDALTDSKFKLLRIDKNQYYPDEPLYHWLVGPSDALNHGLEVATGSWIARIDDDDWWYPDTLGILLDEVRHNNSEFISAVATGPNGCIAPYENPKVGSVQTWLYRNYRGCFRYNLNSWRKSWDKNNEIDLYKRMYKAGMKFDYIPYILCDIRPRPGNINIGLRAYLKEYGNVEK